MNTIILVIIGLLWSGISGAIAWVVKGHRDEGRYIRDVAARMECNNAQKLIVQANADYETLRQERAHLATKNAALAAQVKDVIARNVVLVAQVEDRNEAIDALRLQLAEALKPRKRAKGQPVKAEVAE